MSDTRAVRAGDAFRTVVSQTAAGELVRKRTVWRKNLSGTSVYHFCPFCMKRLGVKPADLRKYFAIAQRKGRKTESEKAFLERVAGSGIVPLDTVRNKLLVKYPSDNGNYGVVGYETRWVCPMCKRELTADDVAQPYMAPPAPNAGEKKILNLDDPRDMDNF